MGMGDPFHVTPFTSSRPTPIARDIETFVAALAPGPYRRAAAAFGQIPARWRPPRPNAIARDGRSLARVSPFDSWFWPAAIIGPQTGDEQLATDFQADMDGSGWDDEGRLVTGAAFLRSGIWRFHPETQEARK